MTKIIVTNAFSINMLSPEDGETLHFQPITEEQALDLLLSEDWESAVGHADTAAVISDLLEIEVPCNRTNVNLERGTSLLVAQYTGPRLPEGATTLPDGARIQFWQVFHSHYMPWRGNESFTGQRIAEIQFP